MNIRSLIVWSFLAIFSTGVFGTEHGLQVVEVIFANLAFRPHFPREQDIREKYGDGFVTNDNGDEYLNYYLGNGKRWLRFRVDAENKVDRPVTAVILSKLPLASERRLPRHQVNEVGIKGIKLGDSADKVKATFGVPLRQYKGDLGPNRNLIVLEYFPRSLDPGSCIRFYVERGIVAAFSFSSEE